MEHGGRCRARSVAAGDRLVCCSRLGWCRRGGSALPRAIRLADSALPGDRVDVSDRICEGWAANAAGLRCDRPAHGRGDGADCRRADSGRLPRGWRRARRLAVRRWSGIAGLDVPATNAEVRARTHRPPGSPRAARIAAVSARCLRSAAGRCACGEVTHDLPLPAPIRSLPRGLRRVADTSHARRCRSGLPGRAILSDRAQREDGHRPRFARLSMGGIVRVHALHRAVPHGQFLSGSPSERVEGRTRREVRDLHGRSGPR